MSPEEAPYTAHARGFMSVYELLILCSAWKTQEPALLKLIIACSLIQGISGVRVDHEAVQLRSRERALGGLVACRSRLNNRCGSTS